MATLTITDAGDGSGGTAVIAASSGAANVIYATSGFTGAMGAYSMASVGSRTGDGNVTLALATGYYWFQLVSAGVISQAVYQNFSDATQAIEFRILDAVIARVLATGQVASGKAIKKWIPRITDPEFSSLGPIVCVAPPDREKMVGMVTNRDDYEYPVVVACVDKGNHDSVAKLNAVLLLREKLMRAFNAQRLNGVSEVWYCNIYPDLIINPAFFDKNLLVSVFGLGFVARQTRGLV